MNGHRGAWVIIYIEKPNCEPSQAGNLRTIRSNFANFFADPQSVLWAVQPMVPIVRPKHVSRMVFRFLLRPGHLLSPGILDNYSGPLIPPSFRTRQKWIAINTDAKTGKATQWRI